MPDKEFELEFDEEPEIEEPETEEPETEEPETEEAPESKPDPYQAMIDQQSRTIQYLSDQVGVLTKSLGELAEQRQAESAPSPELPDPDDDLWSEDPTKATMLVVDKLHQKYRAEFEAQQAKEREHYQQTQQVQSAQTQSWTEAYRIAPELGQEGLLRDATARIFNNPANGLAGNPIGPILALGAARLLVDQQSGAAESARRQRVRQGAMHGSKQGGGQGKVRLDNQHREMAKRFGVSVKDYEDMLDGMGGD